MIRELEVSTANKVLGVEFWTEKAAGEPALVLTLSALSSPKPLEENTMLPKLVPRAKCSDRLPTLLLFVNEEATRFDEEVPE